MSESEKKFILGGCTPYVGLVLRSGLLSNIISTLLEQAEDSPYRFWLSSCLESWLRGSSEDEQVYCAKSGLIDFLVDYVLGNKLHCAGNLQTAFDLLGELCKGNIVTLQMVLQTMDEERFERLMSVVISNLVDSNVFIRALLLTTERISLSQRIAQGSILYRKQTTSSSSTGEYNGSNDNDEESDDESDEKKKGVYYFWYHELSDEQHEIFFKCPTTLSQREIGWSYRPEESCRSIGIHLTCNIPKRPNSIARLSCFLIENQTSFLRGLLRVVDLHNINHENICCLNTALLLSIFAHRRGQLNSLIEKLQETPDFNDILVNFRQLLWFWNEYYSHRNKDRISLEFSSHLPFSEWWRVVQYLSSKNGLPSTVFWLPKSPYKRAPLTSEQIFRKILSK